MKTITLIISFLLINVYTALSVDCGDGGCPDGWTPASTGWVVIQFDSSHSCIGKICYCYDNLDTNQSELANFYLRKIIWADSTCLLNNHQYLNIDVFKESIMRELIRIHMDDLPFYECPDKWWTSALYTSWCFADYYVIEEGGLIKTPVSTYCLGDGYCYQAYQYCWDTSTTPWSLQVYIYGDPVSYGNSGCYFPLLPGPEWELIHDCQSYCP